MTRLKNAPVCFTLAQMRFNQVLDMEPVLPALQGAFRKAGFSDFSADEGRNVELRPGPDGLSLSQKTVTRYLFRNKQQTAALILDSQALTYALTDYPVFAEFSTTFLHALGVVEAYRGIEYYDRLGMRMLDAIQPMAGDALQNYVISDVFGPASPGVAGMPCQVAATESLFKDGHCTLMLRTRYAGTQVALPPGLIPLQLRLDERFVTGTKQTVMLDSDAFVEQRTDFDIESARQHLVRLKHALAGGFKAIVTPHALTAWR